jgi:hypothetical protein
VLAVNDGWCALEGGAGLAKKTLTEGIVQFHGKQAEADHGSKFF